MTTPKTLDRKARLQLPPIPARPRLPQARLQDFNEILILHTAAEAQAEASRCLHCPTAPCQEACPLHNDIPRALALLAEGDIAGAAAVYRETNPLTEICGRICPTSFCQEACTLNKLGRGIDTRHLEAFLATYQRRRDGIPLPEVLPPTGKRVAIVGSGPAGLTAAEMLTRQGHQAVVYEKHPIPGGLLMYGIPGFKLARDVVEAKIAWLEALGVEFRCRTTVGQDISIETLQAEFDAIFLGIGAERHLYPGLPGEHLTGVYDAIEFLTRANLPSDYLPPAWQAPLEVGPRVHVLGGGDTAMDCLRTALRLEDVVEATCYYRRSEIEMPAHEQDYTYALEEGAAFQWLTCPTEFLADEQGRLRAVTYQQMELCEPDESGRSRPVPICGSEFTVETDTIVLAFGFRPVRELPEIIPGLATDRKGRIVVEDRETGATNLPGIFAAGDVVRGADLVATAVANALHVAKTIDATLRA